MGIEPETVQCGGQHSNHVATLARAGLYMSFLIFLVFTRDYLYKYNQIQIFFIFFLYKYGHYSYCFVPYLFYLVVYIGSFHISAKSAYSFFSTVAIMHNVYVTIPLLMSA